MAKLLLGLGLPSGVCNLQFRPTVGYKMQNLLQTIYIFSMSTFFSIIWRFFLLPQQLYMAAGDSDNEGSSKNGASVNGSLSLAEPVACAGSSSPLLCTDASPRDGQQPEQVCVVCHYFPLSRALLPCESTILISKSSFKYFYFSQHSTQICRFFPYFSHLIIGSNSGRHTCVCAVCFCK